jgi:hypothetical protein
MTHSAMRSNQKILNGQEHSDNDSDVKVLRQHWVMGCKQENISKRDLETIHQQY